MDQQLHYLEQEANKEEEKDPSSLETSLHQELLWHRKWMQIVNNLRSRHLSTFLFKREYLKWSVWWCSSVIGCEVQTEDTLTLCLGTVIGSNTLLTFFLTPSWTLESLRSTGGRNLEMMSCSCSSVSAWPRRRNTRSSWSVRKHIQHLDSLPCFILRAAAAITQDNTPHRRSVWKNNQLSL